MPGRSPRRVDGSAGLRPGACGGYSVRRSGRLTEAAMSSPWGGFGWFLRLPGDGFEDAEADEQTEGSGEKNGPGVGGELEGGTGVWGGHGGVSLEENAPHTNECGLR